MDKAQIENLIQQGIQQGIEKYMSEKQYNISRIPNHTHTGTDVAKIPISSIEESITLIGIKGGVIDPAILNTQTLNRKYTDPAGTAQKINVLPINIIYGNGVGIHSAFEGGEAESGTMIFFENGLTLSQLWIKTDNGWYGFSPDTSM